MNIDPERIQAQLGIQKIQPDKPAAEQQSIREAGEQFRQALEKARQTGQVPDVSFSAHASERLLQRGISLDAGDLKKISEGIDRAAEKGAKDSLMILRDMALIVSVENRTVITALQGETAKDNVFTQIDSAILL
jgi:flagellar operon protein